jgi:hypothetical protein
LEFCLKHTHQNCMNGLKNANPPWPPMYEFPLKSRFYITHLYRGFPGSCAELDCRVLLQLQLLKKGVSFHCGSILECYDINSLLD